MIGDLFYRLGTIAGTGLGIVESGVPVPGDDPEPEESPTDGGSQESDDGDLLVNTVLGAAAAWVVKTVLHPRSVSWPRVVIAGVGATVLAEAVDRALGGRDREEEPDPDAVLIQLGAGIAMAAGYASVLYPRLPGSPLAKGLIFGAMEVAASPHGGLVSVATDTPGLKFPLKDLAVPIDDRHGPLANVAFGVGLGLLYRPDLDSEGENDEE